MILHALIILALSTTAAAAQLAPPAPIWSGFYVGAVGGQISGTSDGTLSHNDPLAPGETATTLFGSPSVSFSQTGSAASLVLGYNWQPIDSMFVFGIETDMGWVGAADSKTVTGPTQTWHLESKLYSLGT